jgi:hypothetical protein
MLTKKRVKMLEAWTRLGTESVSLHREINRQWSSDHVTKQGVTRQESSHFIFPVERSEGMLQNSSQKSRSCKANPLYNPLVSPS